MTDLDELWVPLVDEPIGTIVEQIQAEDPELEQLVGSPRRVLAFRTFAYIRVGLMLGQMLFDNDVPPYDGSETWVEALLRDPPTTPSSRARCGPSPRRSRPTRPTRDEEPLGPDDEARERFRRFARETARLGLTRRGSVSVARVRVDERGRRDPGCEQRCERGRDRHGGDQPDRADEGGDDLAPRPPRC